MQVPRSHQWVMRALFTSTMVGIACETGCSEGDKPATKQVKDDVVNVTTLYPMITSPPSQDYAGSKTCSACHAEMYDKWIGSHHDLAMQVADEQTVLGNFDDARFVHHGVETTFYRKDDGHYVQTDGPDGALHEYRIAYTLGVYPLQQYLIAFPGGRYQALGICWDSRPANAGGQRWFHLYLDDKITHDNIFHWTGPNQNWNFMCAECHSTNLQKRFDLTTNSYDTTWSEINVGCEACHGPAAEHVAWARSHHGDAATTSTNDYGKKLRSDESAIGLPFHLKEPTEGRWHLEASTGRYVRNPPLTSHVQVEMCARCHARRNLIDERYDHGRILMETHDPVLLRDGLYHADGQILDEVYVYGSFVQSRMYHHGVRCTDCHDPHSLELRVPGNALCTQCHLSDRYDTPAHHFHQVTSSGASCTACHMPARTYMVVDPRRDHSIRIPRPDLSITLGTPNACNQCHHDRDARWATDAVAGWYGTDRGDKPHYGEVIHAGRHNLPGAADLLTALVRDFDAPAIARSTALMLLAGQTPRHVQAAIHFAVRDEHPLIRRSAMHALESYPAPVRLAQAAHLLQDPVRAVRIEAARILAAIQPDTLDAKQQAALARAVEEYIASQHANAERPEAHLNLGNLYLDLGRIEEAESAYLTANHINPASVQSHVNLADLYRRTKREQDCERVLRQAITINPHAAPSHHALGLALVRQKRLDEALISLETAARMDPDTAHFAFVHAVALQNAGRSKESIEVLEIAQHRHPHDRVLLTTLVNYHRAAGTIERAIPFAEKLLALDPANISFRSMVESMRTEVRLSSPDKPQRP